MRRAWIAFVLLSACGQSTPDDPEVPPLLDDDGRLLTLTCPGDPACRAADGPLRVGVGVRTITPAVETWEDDGDGRWEEGEAFEDLDGDGEYDPVWLAGFGRGRAATGVHDDLWARAMAFSRGDLVVGVVALDLIGYFSDDVIRVREAAREAGLGYDYVLVASTHNHESPDAMGPWGETPFESGRDETYLDEIVRRAVEALADAKSSLTDAELTVATATDTRHLIDDSRDPEVVDTTVTALLARDTTGAAIASLVLWGNHPEALDDVNTLITSDYPHYLREGMEAHFDAPSLFLPGTLGGLMNPLHIQGCPDADGNRTCPAGTYELAEYIGGEVAARAIAALEAAPASTDQTLGARRERVQLTIANFAFLTGYIAGLFDRRVFDADDEPLTRAQAEAFNVDEALAGAVQIQSEVGAVTLGPLEIVTVPGELYPELWMTDGEGGSFIVENEGVDFLDAAPEPPLVTLMPEGRTRAIVNQGNDALGYIIPKVQFDFDEPFAYGRRQYGEVNSLGPDIAPSLAEGIQRLYGR
ncbi:MAG: hypothetical protein RMA76_34420 [Deltaproteobacteria bacterium]|jgi:hypothetical protein